MQNARSSKEVLGDVLKMVERLQTDYPRMELGQLAVLLRVLITPGQNSKTLAQQSGTSKSSLSRSVRVMGQGPYSYDGTGEIKNGLNWIALVPDGLDGRASLVAPTRLGYQVGMDIVRIIRGQNNG